MQKTYYCNHIRRFHELFFTLSPDKDAFENNIRRALFLMDRSAFAYYRDLQKKGYYNRTGSKYCKINSLKENYY